MTRSSHARVRAVVVATVESEHLPQTLAALTAQTRAPDEVVLVHSSERAAQTRDTVTAAALEVTLVAVPTSTGLGPAVDAALAETSSGDDAAPSADDWLWLLHDDSAPEPAALERLAGAVESGPSIAVAGCKQVSWTHPDRLVSVGVQHTVDLQRYVGIEDGEVDQGQHDHRTDIDSVGTAGMLVRETVWRDLGGPDPAVGPFGDGRDLSRRARLAGHRVVVVPRAVVRHARAALLGLREESTDHREPDVRASFGRRRTAILHARLTDIAAPLLPLVVLAALLAIPVRVAGRLATKDLRLIVPEVLAPFLAFTGAGSIWRARRRAAQTKKVSRRRLRPLRASLLDVMQVRRDRRMQAATARRRDRAPSELEMRERAVLATRRRLVLGGVLVGALALSAFAVAPLAFGGPLLGGALAPVDGDIGELWRAARSWWLASGDGLAAPPDPMLGLLALVSFLTGGAFGTPVWITIGVVLVLGIPLSALTGWLAAGAATRSLPIRAWGAVTWAVSAPLSFAIAGGRLGAIAAHVALPLVAMLLARTFGVDRRDVVVSGLVGAPTAQSRASATLSREERERRLAALVQTTTTPTGLTLPDGDPGRHDELADVDEPGSSEKPERSKEPDEPEPSQNANPGAVPTPDPALASVISQASGQGSLGAAASAGLALAVVAVGAPILLPVALLAIVLLALLLGRRADLVVGRKRLLLVAVPPLVVLGPLLAHVVGTGDWRILAAGPGLPLASTGSDWEALLGWPQAPPEAGLFGLAQWLALGAGATVVLGALVALARSGGRAKAVRLGWLVAALGLTASVLAPRVDVGAVVADGALQTVRGWAGPGVSVVVLGLLLATLVGTDGLRTVLAGRSFGWRQVGIVGMTLVLSLGAVIGVAGWGSALRAESTLQARSAAPVPALGLETQGSQDRARVLGIWVDENGTVQAQLWRGNGPQLTDTSASAALAALDDARERTDAATRSLQGVVAALSTGDVTDAAAALAEHGVGVVVVPPTGSALTPGVSEVPRTRLVAALDTVAGLDRVTENPSGVIWRVDPSLAVVARVTLVGPDGATPVPSDVVGVDTAIATAPTPRTLVLAERRDAGWRAELNGQPLRAVENGWQQAFAIPAGGAGDLVVRYHTPALTIWNVVTAVTLVATVLIALPIRRRRPSADEEE